MNAGVLENTGTMGSSPRVVVAMDKFKGSVTARQACEALAVGLQDGCPAMWIDIVPIADGGDGSVEALLGAGYDPVDVAVVGPTGLAHRALIAVKGTEGFVELADTCGISLLPAGSLEPMRSGTRGLGLALRAALDLGITRIGIGLGGSASTDGGLGMLQALGVRVTDAVGADCSPDAAGMLAAVEINLSGLDPRVARVEWCVASDVDVPLCGPQGAAVMFGLQKGLLGSEMLVVERGLARWADLVEAACGRSVRDYPGAGAAGGAGFAAIAVLGAQIRSGSEALLNAVGLPDRVLDADLVVTGEGRWDEQTDRGKGPSAVLELAFRSEVAVAVVAGSVQTGLLEGRGLIAVHQLTDRQPDTSRAMRDAPSLLRAIGYQLAQRWSLQPDQERP